MNNAGPQLSVSVTDTVTLGVLSSGIHNASSVL